MIEQRDTRFAELDALIAAGWGHVPYPEIRRVMRRNHGQLPLPPVEYEDEAGRSIAGVRGTTDAILDALAAGCATTHEIVCATGFSMDKVSVALNYLRRRGRVEITGRGVNRRPGKSGGTVFYIYRLVGRAA